MMRQNQESSVQHHLTNTLLKCTLLGQQTCYCIMLGNCGYLNSSLNTFHQIVQYLFARHLFSLLNMAACEDKVVTISAFLTLFFIKAFFYIVSQFQN